MTLSTAGEAFGEESTPGVPYDSLYFPEMPGSKSHSTAGRGGGRSKLTIGNKLIVDGSITVNGQDSVYGGESYEEPFIFLFIFILINLFC